MMLQIADIALDFEATPTRNAGAPKDLFEVLVSTTACSSTGFYQWVSLNAQTPSQAEITTVTGRQGIDPFMTAPTN